MTDKFEEICMCDECKYKWFRKSEFGRKYEFCGKENHEIFNTTEFCPDYIHRKITDE